MRGSNIKNTFILGAGVSGLTAGRVTGLAIYEAEALAGGICSSYYVRPGNKKLLRRLPRDGRAYRFEIGGGHWIFGADAEILKFIGGFTPVKEYRRKSAVFFSKEKLYVPYPLQNNLRFFKKEIRERTLKEINVKPVKEPLTMKEWLEFNFGSTLCRLFFFPFHNLYTAGLYAAIAPQDAYKSPLNISRVIQGAYKVTAPAGYNATFIYPAKGLDVLVGAIARNCDVRYNKRIVRIDTEKRKLYFAQGGSAHYDKLISTLPLNKVMTMAGLDAGVPADPYTSVLVLNIGARRGKNCPDEHWLYIPDSRSGFHRVGFYSNVDNSFLPWSAQRDKSRVSIYVERAYPGGKKPRDKEAKAYADKTVRELQEWGFIKEVEVFDPTWIDVAYTWVWPGSTWREEAVKILKGYNIYQIGRYGAWKFQGIADSIKEGLSFSFKS